MLTRQTSARALRQALVDGGFADGNEQLPALWPALHQWFTLAVDPAEASLHVLEFESGVNRPDADDHPSPPDGLPPIALFHLAVFRVICDEVDGQPAYGQDEHGVEWWYRPDEDWAVVTEQDGWRPDHHIGEFGCVYGRAEFEPFLTQIEQNPAFRVAARKRALLARAFGLDGDEELIAR